jgi:hypothetical protein
MVRFNLGPIQALGVLLVLKKDFCKNLLLFFKIVRVNITKIKIKGEKRENI